MAVTGAALLVATGGGVIGRAWDEGVFDVGEGPAYTPWDTWQAGTGLLPLVRAAILAPSPHNAQAWTFAVGAGRVDLSADLSRGTGAVDPFHRELYVGLGAALENLTLAAWARGYRPTVSLMSAGPGATHAATVILDPTTARAGDLHRAIPRRHTNRFPYADRDIPGAALEAMAQLAGQPGLGPGGEQLGEDVTVLWFAEPPTRRAIGELMVAATEAFVADPDQIGTDYQWFRQSWDDVQRRRDGITLDAAGLPPLTAAMAKILPDQSPEATATSWLDSVRQRHVATAAAYGVIAVRNVDDDVQRITGGRLLERIHLWATAHGLALHHMNQITERADRERQLGITPTFGNALADVLPDGWQALSMVRLGYPTRTPNRSPRRAIDDVLVAARPS